MKIPFTATIIIVAAGAIGLLIWYAVAQPWRGERSLSKPSASVEEKIVANNGIHWHTDLVIIINGQKQEIPANIGLDSIHQPIHTHDSSGTIHLEFQGLVRKKDIKLSQFFKIWNKQFNSNCIFDFCNNENRRVKFLVNGKENSEFENYHFQDDDKIEIHYE